MEMFGYQISAIFGIQIPKLGIVIAVGVAGYFVATFILRVGMSGFAGMASLGKGATSQGAQPRRAASAGKSAGDLIAFDRSIVVASGADWDDIQAVNTALETGADPQVSDAAAAGRLAGIQACLAGCTV